jgi:hypothetical protein
MRLWRFAAACLGVAAMPGCSLAVHGLGAVEDAGVDAQITSTVDAAGVDAQITTTVDAVAPVDAASPSDSGTLVPLDAGNPSLCATAGLLFCDGFENGAGAWTPSVTGGAIAIESGRVYRGAFALHARVNAVTGNNPTVVAIFQFKPAQAWPFPTFVRMFVYLPSPVPPSVGAFVDVLQNQAPYPGLELNFRPPSGFLGATGYNGLDSDWSSSGDLLPTDSWSCIELEIEGPPTNVAHVFASGVELPAMQHALPMDVPPLGILSIGLTYYHANAQPQTDLWIDEVAVNGARIGCAR